VRVGWIFVEYFDELGDYIQRAWAARNRDEETLPDIACEALVEFPAPSDLPELIVGGLLGSDREATPQLAAAGAFGEPGITLYHGRGFVIDVYFWNNAVPAIHNHPFCGCFTILRGRSLHDVYSFELRERLSTGVAIGDLQPDRLTLLQAGSVVPFSFSRYPLIHSLVHVTNPSVSMVVRSIRTFEYYRYFPPHIALAMDAPSDRLSRQLQMFNWLRSAGDPTYVGRLHAFLRFADFETSIRVISAVFDPVINDDLIDIVRVRHGDHADLILPALIESMRLQTENEFRDQFSSDETRTVLSVLMCAHDRADVFRLLAKTYPEVGPRLLLDRLDVVDEGDQADRAAYERLIRGEIETDVWQNTIFRALTIGAGRA
jgi:hypothetical protein